MEINQTVAEKKYNISADDYPILIIDDDTWMQRIIPNYTRAWGFTPVSANNPIDGLALAIKIRPIVIFLDIIMPDMNGDLVLKILKKVELTKHIPVIMISGNLNKSFLKDLMIIGAAGFVSKPFTQKILLEKIQQVVEPRILDKLNLNPIDIDDKLADSLKKM